MMRRRGGGGEGGGGGGGGPPSSLLPLPLLLMVVVVENGPITFGRRPVRRQAPVDVRVMGGEGQLRHAEVIAERLGLRAEPRALSVELDRQEGRKGAVP